MLTHFKNKLKTNLQVISLTSSFYISFNVSLFLLHKLSLTATSVTGTVPV